jgi:DNA-binding transcriptional ArsR family regulator
MRVIIIANSNQRTLEEQNRFEFCKNYARKMEEDEVSLPESARRKYDVLEIPEYESFFQNLAFFRSLIQVITSQDPIDIIIHLNSGPMVWRIALYQCAEEFADIIKFIFIFDKNTGKPEKIRLFRELNDTEKKILSILGDQTEKITLTRLWDKFNNETEKKSLSQILKSVNRLVDEGLVCEIKEGREKMVSISDIGVDLYHNKHYTELIKKFISE